MSAIRIVGNREVVVPDTEERLRIYEQAFKAAIQSLRSFDRGVADHHESALKVLLK